MVSKGDERVGIDGSIIVFNQTELVDVVELEFVVTELRFLIIDCGGEITNVDLSLTRNAAVYSVVAAAPLWPLRPSCAERRPFLIDHGNWRDLVSYLALAWPIDINEIREATSSQITRMFKVLGSSMMAKWPKVGQLLAKFERFQINRQAIESEFKKMQ